VLYTNLVVRDCQREVKLAPNSHESDALA
jgi:hypothetical protein